MIDQKTDTVVTCYSIIFHARCNTVACDQPSYLLHGAFINITVDNSFIILPTSIT